MDMHRAKLEKMSTEDLMDLRTRLAEKIGPYLMRNSKLREQLNAVDRELDLRIYGRELLY